MHKIGIIQMACSPSPSENLARAMDKVRAVAREGAKLVCLPELFTSQYFCQSEDHKYFELAEAIPGPRTEALGALTRELGIYLIAPLFERRAPGLYHNSMVLLDPKGQITGHYRKMHIPDDPLYYEKFYFTPGDLDFQAFATPAGKVGVGICWDQWFPETARLLTLAGAEILFFPTAIGWHPSEKAEFGKSQVEAWQTIQRAHAIANGCYVFAPNRVGLEQPIGGDGIEFWGQSFACDPRGRVLAVASVEREENIVLTIDPQEIERQRTHWPYLRDRRVDAYGTLLKRWGK